MSKGTVLYIEDNEQNYYLVNVLLKTQDYRVLWAQDGREGIEKALELRPDLILLDIQLPVMDGYEVARRLRSNPDLSSVPYYSGDLLCHGRRPGEGC